MNAAALGLGACSHLRPVHAPPLSHPCFCLLSVAIGAVPSVWLDRGCLLYCSLPSHRVSWPDRLGGTSARRLNTFKRTRSSPLHAAQPPPMQRGFSSDWLGGTFSQAVFLGNGLMAILSGALFSLAALSCSCAV